MCIEMGQCQAASESMGLILGAQVSDRTHRRREPGSVAGNVRRTQRLMRFSHIVGEMLMIGSTQHDHQLGSRCPIVDVGYILNGDGRVELGGEEKRRDWPAPCEA